MFTNQSTKETILVLNSIFKKATPLQLKNPVVLQAFTILADDDNRGFTLSDVLNLAKRISNNHYVLSPKRVNYTMVSVSR